MHQMNYLIKVCTFLPSIFMTGVHPPSPHPKFPMWQKTDNGWESTRRVTTPLTLDLLNQNEKKKRKKKRNTTNNKNNDGEIKLELIKIVIIATTVTMKMIMGKILSDNNNNDSTNKQMKSWSFSKRRRQKTAEYKQQPLYQQGLVIYPGIKQVSGGKGYISLLWGQ